jgi:hypothetical protein
MVVNPITIASVPRALVVRTVELFEILSRAQPRDERQDEPRQPSTIRGHLQGALIKRNLPSFQPGAAVYYGFATGAVGFPHFMKTQHFWAP